MFAYGILLYIFPIIQFDLVTYFILFVIQTTVNAVVGNVSGTFSTKTSFCQNTSLILNTIQK